MTTTTLKDILTGSLAYSLEWEVWAEKNETGEFTLESPARFGKIQFEKGGLLDNCDYVASNISIVDKRFKYCGGDKGYYEEWAINFIEELNNRYLN